MSENVDDNDNTDKYNALFGMAAPPTSTPHEDDAKRKPKTSMPTTGIRRNRQMYRNCSQNELLCLGAVSKIRKKSMTMQNPSKGMLRIAD
jgi:hypothetical protein